MRLLVFNMLAVTASASPVLDARRVDFNRVADEYMQIQPSDKPASSARLSNIRDICYLANITVNNQDVLVNLDTGSSDTWLVADNYQCVSITGFPKSRHSCGFKSITPDTSLQPASPFRRFFGDGTFVTGYYTTADVTLGGLTAHHQQIAIANRTHWYGGDGRSSGLLGLAYPSLTGQAYDPVFTSFYKQNGIPPVFALALARYSTTSTSYLSLGGVPPIFYDKNSWSTVPLELPALPHPKRTFSDRTFYLITPTSFIYSKRLHNGSITTVSSQQPFQVSVDAGSTLTILPTSIAAAIFSAFDPPPHWVPSGAAYYAPCNARVPTFGVQIKDQVYYMAADDLLRQTERDPDTKRYCRVGILDSQVPPFTLGVTFLTNVVAVFDLGLNEMRLARTI